jgi:flavin reductase (DIM6/NTAB) family NADH-FMN oxidoreductase RutF
MGQFATGVVVVSTEYEGDAHAMTANAFMSGSLEPPLVLVSVANTARMHERVCRSGWFGVSVLARAQQAVSNHFAGKPSPDHLPRFDRLQGLPVVQGAAVQVAAELCHQYPCGDHTLFVGHVRALRTAPDASPPLLFHSGRYGALAHPDWSAAAIPEGFWENHEYRW